METSHRGFSKAIPAYDLTVVLSITEIVKKCKVSMANIGTFFSASTATRIKLFSRLFVYSASRHYKTTKSSHAHAEEVTR